MSKHTRILAKVLSGLADKNLAFRDLRNLLKHLGFFERIKGDHYIFSREGIEEISNLQPRGSQVKQVRDAILRHQLGDTEGE
jgi:virulence-associated protein VapD